MRVPSPAASTTVRLDRSVIVFLAYVLDAVLDAVVGHLALTELHWRRHKAFSDEVETRFVLPSKCVDWKNPPDFLLMFAM
jgi:hypothetical protein